MPIYTVKAGDVELPIQLNYHSSGIKVSDEATWVGLGWDLSPGGEIIQEVRGKRDEFDIYHLNAASPAAFAAFQTRIQTAGPIGTYRSVQQLGHAFYDPLGCPFICDNGDCIPEQIITADPPDADDGGIVASLLTGNGDPDIYHYSFLGYTGSFYINPETHEIVFIDKDEDIKIEKTTQDIITITTLDGTRFRFDVIEVAYDLGQYPGSEKSGKTFKLGNITLTNGREITFEYINAHTSGIQYSQKYLLYTLEAIPVNQAPPAFQYTQSDTKILSKITTPEAVINFNLGTRDDINLSSNDNLKKLNSIDIISKITSQKIKTFQFDYSYFPYNTTASPANITQLDIHGKRLKLDDVKEIGYQANGDPVNTIPPYTFEYDISNVMPLKCSFAVDFYGYYNGKANTNLLPNLDYFQYNHNSIVPFSFSYTKSNRYTDNQYAGAYMLNKITYPTGGSSQFLYEPNSFTNQFIPDKIAAENVISSNYAYDNSIGSNSDIQFDLDRQTMIHFGNEINNGTGNYNNVPPLTFADMQGCHIELLKSKFVSGVYTAVTIKTWDLSGVTNADFQNNGGKSWSEDLTVDPDPDPNFHFHVKVVYPDNLNNTLFASIAGVSSRFNFNNYAAIDESESHQCGMRIKTIKSFTQAGVLAGTKDYKYLDGKLLNRFNPLNFKYKWIFQCLGGSPLGTCNCPAKLEGAQYPEISITSELVHQGGPLIGYGSVEETELANNSLDNNGKKVFHFTNIENVTSNGYPVIKNLYNGKMTEASIYNSSNALLSKTTSEYGDLFPAIQCYYGLSITQNFTGNYDPIEVATLGTRSKYSYLATPIISQWIKLQSKTMSQYSGAQSISTTEEYTYNEQGKIQSLSTENSKAELKKSFFYYAPDLAYSAINTSLIAGGMTGIPLRIDSYKNSDLLTSRALLYANFNAHILPQSVNQTINSTVLTEITYDKYDDKGNLLQYTDKNGLVTSLIWGYNQLYPVAKVSGRGYDDIISAANLSTAIVGNPSSDNALRTELNKLRLLAHCLVTTLTYRPLVGQTSETDPSGKTNYYEYDEYNRLKLIRDQDNNIIKSFDYQYHN